VQKLMKFFSDVAAWSQFWAQFQHARGDRALRDMKLRVAWRGDLGMTQILKFRRLSQFFTQSAHPG